MSRVSHELTNPAAFAGSKAPSPHHSPERSSAKNSKTPTSSTRGSGGGISSDGNKTGENARRLRHARSHSTTPTSGAAAAIGGDGTVTTAAASAAAAAISLIDRAGKGSPDSASPAGASAGAEAGGRGSDVGHAGESSLWPFRGAGDSPPRSRTGSTTAAQALFSR